MKRAAAVAIVTRTMAYVLGMKTRPQQRAQLFFSYRCRNQYGYDFQSAKLAEAMDYFR
ncbi:MAG: hypothetical protein QOD84_2075 [Acidobacteriaceae bacterium]